MSIGKSDGAVVNKPSRGLLVAIPDASLIPIPIIRKTIPIPNNDEIIYSN